MAVRTTVRGLRWVLETVLTGSAEIWTEGRELREGVLPHGQEGAINTDEKLRGGKSL